MLPIWRAPIWRTRRQRAWPRIILMFAAFAAGAVVAGVVLQLVHPIHRLKPPPPPPPPPPAVAPFTAASGWNCHGAANDGSGAQVHGLVLAAKSGQFR